MGQREHEATIPMWALSAILSASRETNYGDLIGRYVVCDTLGVTKILYAIDFHQQYVVYHERNSGHLMATPGLSRECECPGKDYLQAMAQYLKRLGSLWEGPDGCGTYETETLEKLANQLFTFASQSETARVQDILPFVYQRPQAKEKS